jgi:3-methyladenine DNA glycosylase AlkD
MPDPQKAVVTVSPRVAARAIERRIAALARPAGSFDASRYFRGASDLGFHNVGARTIRSVARDAHLEHRSGWSVDDAVACADLLMSSRYLEVKAAGVELLGRYRREFHPRMLKTWRRWLAEGRAANWATTDAICGLLIGPLLVRHPELAASLRKWTSDGSLWVRRAGAVGLIPLARRGRALATAYGVARDLHPDREDLIQKAVGWMLREAGKADSARLERYLLANGPRIPRTTLRYAIERFPAARRRALLEQTRAGAARRRAL